MTYMLSIVTYNRRDILARTLEAIEQTCLEEHKVLITDGGSTDGTVEMLTEMEKAGKLRLWLMPDGSGIAKCRNAHWGECVGKDAVKIDDKVLMTAPGWLTTCKAQSERNHALVGFPYDPTVQHFYRIAPLVDFIVHPGQHQAGEGGPMTFVPAGVSEALGAWDEIPGCLYGWEEILYNHRARLLGWQYGFSLRIPHEILASANPAGRAHAMEHHAAYVRLCEEYQNGERDVWIDPKDTEGWRIWYDAQPVPKGCCTALIIPDDSGITFPAGTTPAVHPQYGGDLPLLKL